MIGYAQKNANSGDSQRTNLICNIVTDPIIILGSSRAENHYNSNIIADTLGMSCYNCGMSGNGILLNYGFYAMIMERYRPKFIIYDYYVGGDLLKADDNHKYTAGLKAYY